MATTSCPSDCVMLSRWASRSTTKSDALTVYQHGDAEAGKRQEDPLAKALRKHRLAAYSAAAGGWAATAVPRGGGTRR